MSYNLQIIFYILRHLIVRYDLIDGGTRNNFLLESYFSPRESFGFKVLLKFEIKYQVLYSSTGICKGH